MELPPEVYRRLLREASRLGKSPQDLVQDWLVERLMAGRPGPDGERRRARQALQAAGLLAELSPHLQELADPTVRLEDVRAALERSGEKSLSEIVLEQRGPKE
jgi:hypothetical protein